MAERPQIEQGLEVAFNPFCALSRSHVTLCCLVNLPIGVFEDEREKLVGVVSNCYIGLFGGRIRFFYTREFIQQRRLEPQKLLRLRANGGAQQLPTLLRQQRWELLRACWQWCANRCNNFQQVWDLQCIVGRIQPISLGNPCVMSVRGPNNVGRAVQTDLTLLSYASAITEQKKC